MNLRAFIERPVLASVISILIVFAGVIGLASLPIEQYPNIAPPTVMVHATYPGAGAETIQKSVIVPLEEAINGVENMMYISSTASTGTASINIFFRQGTDPDMAAVNVQNKVATATALLPAEVNQIGVFTMKRQTSMLRVFSTYSPDGRYDENFISNYVKINLEPQIQRIQGVGECFTLGADYAMRIWLKPEVMAQYKIMPSDITYALAEQNIEAAAGALGSESENAFQFTLRYKGRLTTPEEFEQIVIRSTPDGQVLQLKDVADIELGAESYAYKGLLNGSPGLMTMIMQTPGSNATEIVENIDALLDEVEADMPEGLAIARVMSVNDFLYASIHEVIKTLLEAILLVILVVYVFLQDIRSTIVPTISILVSLIGTFAFMVVAGFSINILTLFALVLAIGTVVDDAVIVVEAVQAKFDEGYRSPKKATVDAMSGITSAIITSTLVFMAVFIPTSMMGGTSGIFYTQFGITMAVAVGISAVNALTLSPALCALMLKPYLDEDGNAKNNFAARFRKVFNAGFGAMIKKYKHGVLLFIKHKWLAWGTLLGVLALLVVLMNNTKSGMVPDEDMGVVMVQVSAAPGATLNETDQIMKEVAGRIRSIPQVRIVSQVAGYGLMAGAGSSYGMCIVKLKDWSERPEKSDNVQAVIQQIYGRTMDIKNAQIFAIAPPMITGYGTTSGFEMYLQDKVGGSVNDFYNVYLQYVAALNQRPEIAMAYSSFSINFPQYIFDIDAAKAKRAGVSPADLLSAMSSYFGSSYISNINRFSKVYRVTMQARAIDRDDPESLNNIYVRNSVGEMAPVSQFVEMKKIYGPEVLNRFNLYNSISISGSVADGYSTGDAITAIREVADQVLPRGYGYDFGGMTREETTTTNNTGIIFGICILIIYLILAALYESFFVPFAVILSVPCGLMGSFLFAKTMGMENNIYLQTGLIMLIGLLAKTAILLTEYAGQRREQGMSLSQAAISAAKARLRPILMTVATMIFGMLPLVFSHGVGANGNSTLGTGVVGGMLIGTLALLFLVPMLFIVFQTLQEKVKPIQFKKETQEGDNE